MQNNGLIKFFTVLFGLVSLYQLSFTFVTSKVESDAKTYAQTSVNTDDPDYFTLVDIAESNYLDSIAEQKVFGVFNYATAKDRELNKGLDLKGGINVILQVSVKDILKGLAENSRNPLFNQSLARADVLQKSSDDTYVESFFVAFEELKGDENLSNPDIFGNRTLSDDINFNMTDDEVKPVIRRKIDASIVSAFEVLRKRIDKFGVTQPNIQRLGTSGRILVELPGARDVDRVKNLLQSTAQLEFWETASNQSFGTFLGQANELLKTVLETEEDEEEISEIDDLLSDVAAAQDSITTVVNPIYDYVKGAGYAGGPVLIQVDIKDQPTVESYLNRSDVRAL
jgi:SecD/SecF fusion protein